MKTRIAITFIAAALAASGGPQAAQRDFPSGFSVALDRGDELAEALPAKFGEQLDPQAVALQPQDVPWITPISTKTEDKLLLQVSVSAGFIDLVNHLSHAKAIDRIEPGFFDLYVQNLAKMVGDDFFLQPPGMVDERFWTDDVMNDQSSYFNQMIGVMLAINLSHHYLGHFGKYSLEMAGPGLAIIPINDFLTPAEWEASVKAGATDALDCALATDGVKALFEAIDQMSLRPAWTEYIVPKGADLKKLNKELTRYEKDFFRGGLKFTMHNKLEFLTAPGRRIFICPAGESISCAIVFKAATKSLLIDGVLDESTSQRPYAVPGMPQGMGYSTCPMVKIESPAFRQNVRNN